MGCSPPWIFDEKVTHITLLPQGKLYLSDRKLIIDSEKLLLLTTHNSSCSNRWAYLSGSQGGVLLGLHWKSPIWNPVTTLGYCFLQVHLRLASYRFGFVVFAVVVEWSTAALVVEQGWTFWPLYWEVGMRCWLDWCLIPARFGSLRRRPRWFLRLPQFGLCQALLGWQDEEIVLACL